MASLSSHYRVRLVPEKQQLEVELRLSGLGAGEALELCIPTWVPGAYAFLKYGRDVFDVQALDTTTGKELPLTRRGWNAIFIEKYPAEVTLRHKAHAADVAWGEVTGLITGEQAILLGTHYFFASGESGVCRVDYELPPGWEMHHPSGARALGPFSWEYPSYAALLDTPVVAGVFHRQTRECRGTKFHHVFVDKAVGYESESSSLIDAVMKTAEECFAIFGSFPFDDYSFIYTCDPRSHWGLEHANATMVAIGANVFIDPEQRLVAVRVAAHELLHAWNVCRMKPHALKEPDFSHGSFPDGLWISEGFTRYYEFLLSVRAGEIPCARFIGNVVNYYTHLAERPAYARVSAIDSSRSTFLNHNKYPGSINNTIDYYDTGMLIAFDLDAALRTAGGTATLDREFRAFYEAHGKKGFSSEEAVAFFGSRSPGVAELLTREVNHPGALSVPAQLTRLGFALTASRVPHLGMILKDNLGPLVVNVLDNGPAGEAGLAAEDEIVKTNGFAFHLAALKWLVSKGEPLSLEVRRGHVYRTLSMTPRTRETITALTWQGSPAQLLLLRAWFGQPGFTLAPGEEIPLTFFDNFHGVETIL